MRRALLAAILAVLAIGGVTVVSARSHPTDGLPAVAEAAWRARNVYRVSGEVRTEPAYDAWLRGQLAMLDDWRQGLADTGLAYVAELTELTGVEDVFARRDRAKITVMIRSVLDMRGDEGTPAYTAGNEELEFHFRWVGGAWVLRAVKSLGKG